MIERQDTPGHKKKQSFTVRGTLAHKLYADKTGDPLLLQQERAYRVGGTAKFIDLRGFEMIEEESEWQKMSLNTGETSQGSLRSVCWLGATKSWGSSLTDC